jgi:glycosyltransferase involved in cell wall biosynthesis
MTYDLIIVTQSKGDLIQVTQQCIDSARQDNADLNIIIVETGNPYLYNVDKIIEYNGEFNYNRALNLGLKYAKGDIHVLANNDLIFHKGWSEIGNLMLSNGYHSASILSQDVKEFQRGDFVYEGYTIGKHLTGWCIFMDKFCHSEIGSLDETCSFWYSDDLYALQLKKAGIRHGLFCNLQIDHITSRTLIKQPSALQRRFQDGEFRKFRQRQLYYAKTEKVHRVNS